MAYLKEKLEQLEKANKAWKEVLDMEFSDVIRDAAIQRYEFSYELLWKTVKTYLKEIEGIDCFSPKACFRELRNLLNLSEEDVEVCLKMTADRNLSVHTYSEEMANDLYKRLADYWKVSDEIALKIKTKKS